MTSERDILIANLERRVEQLTCELETTRSDKGRLELELASLKGVFLAEVQERSAFQGVYFIAHAGFIKIGCSGDVRKRLQGLQLPDTPAGLGWIPCDGGMAMYDVERALHQEFAALRGRGEWFRDEAPLRACIQERAQAWPT